MNEETNQSQEPVETNVETQPEAPTPSLDEIANEFNVEKEADNFQAQPQAPAPAQPQYDQAPQSFESQIPDPTYDPEGYSRYMQQQSQQTAQITNTLGELVNKVQTYEQQMAQQKVEADLGKAVNRVNEKLNVDPDMAETALEIEYRKNPAFQKIWNNRDSNPKAFEKALDVIADKWSGKFATRTNDQLVENVRAAKTSQQTLSSAPANDPNDEWANLSPGEFQRKWSQLKNG